MIAHAQERRERLDRVVVVNSRQTIPRTTLTVCNAVLFLFHAGLAALTLGVGTVDLEVPLYKSKIDFRFVTNDSASGDDNTPWELVPVYVRGGRSCSPGGWHPSLFCPPSSIS